MKTEAVCRLCRHGRQRKEPSGICCKGYGMCSDGNKKPKAGTECRSRCNNNRAALQKLIRRIAPGRTGRIPLEGCRLSRRGENRGSMPALPALPPTKRASVQIVLRLLKLAATHFPTWYSSIIGVNGLNFSVRDGKRWIPVAIATENNLSLMRYA